MTNIFYKDETYKIVGICIDIYNSPGFGFLEIVYKDAMEIEFLEKENLNTKEWFSDFAFN